MLQIAENIHDYDHVPPGDPGTHRQWNHNEWATLTSLYVISSISNGKYFTIFFTSPLIFTPMNTFHFIKGKNILINISQSKQTFLPLYFVCGWFRFSNLNLHFVSIKSDKKKKSLPHIPSKSNLLSIINSIYSSMTFRGFQNYHRRKLLRMFLWIIETNKSSMWMGSM